MNGKEARKRGRPSVPEQIVGEVVRLRDAGLSWGQVGEALKIHRQTARTVYLRETGPGTVYDKSPEGDEGGTGHP